MPTQLLPTREETASAEKVGSGFVLALVLHLAVIAALLAAAFLAHRSNIHFGQNDPLSGAMKVSAVSSLPLPPKQRYEENKVLTSDKPSIAPTPPAPAPPEPKAKPAPPKADPPPRLNEVLIPTKVKPEPTKPAATKPAGQPATAVKPVETPAPVTRTPPPAHPQGHHGRNLRHPDPPIHPPGQNRDLRRRHRGAQLRRPLRLLRQAHQSGHPARQAAGA